MNQVETDFIEFVAKRNNESIDEVEKRYTKTKQVIDFSSKEFSAQEELNYQTLQVFFNDKDDLSAFESYRYYAYTDIMRMIGYSFPKKATAKGYFKTFLKALKNGDTEKIRSFLKRKSSGEKEIPLVERLLENHPAPTILDYGCGLAYVSFEMAQKSPGAKVILVDLDTVKLDFTEFRFQKYSIPYQTIRMEKGGLYPELPPHTICIATDVMEHLYQPLLAYKNIHSSMEMGGILYGNFEDHKEGIFHVHPDMDDLRKAVAQNYRQLHPKIYEKIS